MTQEIMGTYPVKIRKERHCHDCLRVFQKGTEMFTSVWKNDDVYRLWECKDCIEWIGNNHKEFNELAYDCGLTTGWMLETEPIPEFLKPKF